MLFSVGNHGKAPEGIETAALPVLGPRPVMCVVRLKAGQAA